MPIKCPKGKKEVYFYTKHKVRLGGCASIDDKTGKMIDFVVKEAKKAEDIVKKKI